MEPADAAVKVLADAGGEMLHWTVVWDRALRAGYLNPIERPGARGELIAELARLARAGSIVRTSKGTYRHA
jgi:hypothetical protein